MIRLETIIAPPLTAPMPDQIAAPHSNLGYSRPVADSADLQRIMALPRRALEMDGTPRAEAIIDIETEKYSLGNVSCRCAEINPERHAAEGCIKRLRLVQALVLREIAIVGGMLGPIGVGYGKTLCDLLAPYAFDIHARASGLPPDPNGMLCVLLVPPGLVKQLASDREYIGQHFKMPTTIFQGSPHLDRVVPGAPRLQVMPYSLIQRADRTSWFNHVRPHAVIADECHKLRNPNTSTTSRVFNYFNANRGTRMAAWSGSLTSKSIKDYSMIAGYCLKGGSPLPLSYEVTEDWARAIDPGGEADPGALLDGLIRTGCCLPGESLYTGVRRRITETTGVVSTSTPIANCELVVSERPAPPMPTRLIPTPSCPEGATLLQHMERALGFIRPDSEELVTAMQAVECAITISLGFYYKWIYPKAEFPRDTLLVLAWLERRKLWHQELRAKLKTRSEHLDSPQLCEYAAQRAIGVRPIHKGLPVWHSKTYREWYEIKGKVEPKGIAVRMDDYVVQDAARWAREHRGIIWYEHQPWGEWVAEISGLPMYGGGKDAKLALLGDPAKGIPGERGDRSVICSIEAHGTGTNGLQYVFADQLFETPSADPAKWEQAVGRLRRPGQRSKIVRAWSYMHTPAMRKRMLAALRGAQYVAGTLPNKQQLLTGFDAELWEQLEEDPDLE